MGRGETEKLAEGEPSGKEAHTWQGYGLAVSLVPMFDENYLMLIMPVEASEK